MENDNYVCIGGVSSCFNGARNFYVRNFKLENVMFNGIKHDECTYNSVDLRFHHIKAKHFRDEKTAEMLLSAEHRENRTNLLLILVTLHGTRSRMML